MLIPLFYMHRKQFPHSIPWMAECWRWRLQLQGYCSPYVDDLFPFSATLVPLVEIWLTLLELSFKCQTLCARSFVCDSSEVYCCGSWVWCIFSGDLFTACRWNEIFASCWLWILSWVVWCCCVQSHKQVAISLLAGRIYNLDLTLNLNLFWGLCLMNLLLSAPGRDETTCKKNHSSFCGKDPTNCHWWNVSQVQFFTLPWSHISFCHGDAFCKYLEP
jgi:hypothetical protein